MIRENILSSMAVRRVYLEIVPLSLEEVRRACPLTPAASFALMQLLEEVVSLQAL
jgi:hypothetical protein